MKKLFSIVISALLVCSAPIALTACSQKGGADEGAADTSAKTETETLPFATLGDVFADETSSMMSVFDEQRYVCGFELDGTWYRVEAALEDGMYNELNEVWVEDQNRVKELLSPLAVTKVDTVAPLDDAAIESYAGKTGADLAADGFVFLTGSSVVNGEQTDCSATNGNFDYLVTFDGALENEMTEDLGADVADMTVSSVSLQGISWALLEG